MITTILAAMSGAAAPSPRKKRRKKDVDPSQVTSRTKMGARQVRRNDLVRVKDPLDSGTTFVARVTGGYTLAGVWHLQLASLEGCGRIPRQSTRDRHVCEHWVRTGRSRP